MRRSAKLASAIATLLLVLVLAAAAQAASLTRAESKLLSAVNRARALNGLHLLRVDWTLEAAARAHSIVMMRTDAFGHGDVFGRLRSFGATGPVLAENIAWGSGRDANASAIVRQWLASPHHRAVSSAPASAGSASGRSADPLRVSGTHWW